MNHLTPPTANSRPAVLIVDNQPSRLNALSGALRRQSYQVFVTPDGPTAICLIAAQPPDLVVLNLLLPSTVAGDVCRAIRQTHATPILMLGDRQGRQGLASHYALGANDYVVRLCNLDELLGHIQSLLHRPPAWADVPDDGQGVYPPSGMLPVTATPLPAFHPTRFVGDHEPPLVLHTGELVIDLAARTVLRAGRAVHLKPQEFDLLAFLAQHAGRVFSRDVLLQRVWGHEQEGNQRTVDVHVRWLRTKLEPVPGEPTIIQTVHRVGYRFSPAVEPQPEAS